MKRCKKRITRALLRRYFGSEAKIRGFWGQYRVTTPTGGEIVVSNRKIEIVFGLDDTYRTVVLLVGECWGSGVIRSDSREFTLGVMAHGETEGVNIQPKFTNPSCTLAKWCAAVILLWLGITAGFDQSWFGVVGVVFGVILVIEQIQGKTKREEQRKAQELGFHYPRVYGSAGAARHDDAKREGWL